MSELAAIKLVEQLLGECLGERMLWFSMKFDRRIVLSFRKDGDFLKLIKGIDEFAFMYMRGRMGQVAEQWKCAPKK